MYGFHPPVRIMPASLAASLTMPWCAGHSNQVHVDHCSEDWAVKAAIFVGIRLASVACSPERLV